MPNIPDLFLFEEAPRYEFSSRGTRSLVVNPTPDSRNNNEVHFGSTNFGKKDSRKVLRSPIRILRRSLRHRNSSVEEDGLHSSSFVFNRGKPLGNQTFSFKQYLSLKNKIPEISYRMPQKIYKIKEDPAGVPLNSGSVESSHKSVIKLMDSKGNLSCNSTINSKTPHRKREELSRDSLLSPQAESIIAERSFPESRASGEVVKRNAPLQFQMARSGTRMRHSKQSRKKGSSREGKDLTVTIPPFILPKFEQSYQQMLKNHGFSPILMIPQKSRQDVLIRTARSTPSVSI